MTKRDQFRAEINEYSTLPVDETLEGVEKLREMVEATISANIAVGPPKGGIPGNNTGTPPKKIGSDDHGIDQIEIDDVDDEDIDRDNMDIQAGSGSVNEMLEIINSMDEGTFDEYTDNLSEEDLEVLINILEETDEDEPDDIDEFEVDDIDDTEDDERRHAYGDIKAGSGMGVDVKESFRDTIFNLPSLSEGHYDLGEKVTCKKSGMTGVIVKSEGEGESEVYHVKFPNGKTMQYAPTDITPVDEGDDVGESIYSGGKLVAKRAGKISKKLGRKRWDPKLGKLVLQ